MNFAKKLNLLPQSHKDRYANRYIALGFGGVFAVLVLILSTAFINLGLAKLSIKRLTEENTDYKNKQAKITSLEESIGKSGEIINEYQKDNFPFYSFMQAVEQQKPAGLTIISIDSADRLIPREEQPEKIPESQSIKETEKETEESAPVKAASYEKDLSGSKLIVRGYSANPSDIASFVNTLSRLFYVSETELKAIEEHTINGYDTVNIFETILQLK